MSIVILFVIWNIIVFLTYGADKIFARRGMRRISEVSLISFAFLWGGIGALLGMSVFHHKTRKKLFKFCVPVGFIISVATLILYIYGQEQGRLPF